MSNKEVEIVKDDDSKEISQSVMDLVEKIRSGITIDKTTGIGKEVDEAGKLYRSNLPKDLSVATVKKVNDYNKDFAAATAYVSGELAVDAMKKNKDLNVCKVELSTMNRNRIVHSIERCRTFSDYQHGTEVVEKNDKGEIIGRRIEPKAVPKKAYMHTTIKTSYGKNSGNMALVREAIRALAENSDI